MRGRVRNDGTGGICNDIIDGINWKDPVFSVESERHVEIRAGYSSGYYYFGPMLVTARLRSRNIPSGLPTWPCWFGELLNGETRLLPCLWNSLSLCLNNSSCRKFRNESLSRIEVHDFRNSGPNTMGHRPARHHMAELQNSKDSGKQGLIQEHVEAWLTTSAQKNTVLLKPETSVPNPIMHV